MISPLYRIYAYPHIEHALAFNFLWTGQPQHLKLLEELFTRVLCYYTGRLAPDEKIGKVVQQEMDYMKSMRNSWEEIKLKLNDLS